MDPYSKMQQLKEMADTMNKTIAGLENDVLNTLKENTELKVENELLREKLDKFTKKGVTPKTHSGLDSLKQIYNSGYHICNMYYGTHRDMNEECMLCMDILDNFGEKAVKK